jgi:hypothetical protein
LSITTLVITTYTQNTTVYTTNQCTGHCLNHLYEVKTFCEKLLVGLWRLTPLSTIYRGGGNQRKPPTCHKSLTILSHNAVSSTPHDERGSNSQL